MFYRARAEYPEEWKVQPSKDASLRREATMCPWWLPLLGFFRVANGRRLGKEGRHPLHALFATVNLLTASSIAGTVAHFVVANKTRIHDQTLHQGGFLAAITGLMLSLVWQSVLEYYWHRLMHLPYVYKRLHKYHHHYKSPEPFDDLMIHPLEAFGYYLQLYSPPFIFRMPLASFIAYMIICGLCGVLDHSGVAFRFPGLYSTLDHDRHHSKFEVNYAFPFPVMDVLHGTFDGSFLGREYTCSRGGRRRTLTR